MMRDGVKKRVQSWISNGIMQDGVDKRVQGWISNWMRWLRRPARRKQRRAVPPSSISLEPRLLLSVISDRYEPDNTPATASSITTDGRKQTHSFHRTKDMDYIFFQLTARSNLTVTTDGDAGGDTVLLLFDGETGNTLLASDQDSGPGRYAKLVLTGSKALPAGDYLIRVSENGQNNTLKRYTVSALATPVPDAYESDDTPELARLITTDDVAQTRSLHVRTDVDHLKFRVDVRSHVTITTDGDAGGDANLSLYGPNSSTSLVESNEDSGTGNYPLILRTGANALEAGWYYLRIGETGQDSTISRYTIRVLATDVYEDDDVAAKAKTIATNGSKQNRSFHDGADVDWVRFTITQSQTVTIETDGIQGGDTQMELFRSDGTTRIGYDGDSGPGYYSHIKRKLAAGTYFVRLTDYGQNNSLALYTLRVRLG